MADQMSDGALREGLENAIAEGHIVPWFQPVMDPGGVNMLSAEALPRWEDPVKGVIPAGIFISTAIKHGLLEKISKILLDSSCANFADWRERGIAPTCVSVNFTGAELRSKTSVDQIRWALEKYEMKPEQLAIEIPEKVLHEEGWEQSLETAKQMRANGTPFWLDDFGADKCDPKNIAKLDFAWTKVDRGIVGSLDDNPDMVERLGQLVEQAQGEGLKIIAKGVETRTQIDILVEKGCDGQQGFAIARPMAPDAFAEWLDLNTWTGDFAQSA
ncbi:MAG: EAL domain-containing protein [Pseudomonadota bacterium]